MVVANVYDLPSIFMDGGGDHLRVVWPNPISSNNKDCLLLFAVISPVLKECVDNQNIHLSLTSNV